MIKVILLSFLSWGGHHASDSLRLETIDGKQFIIHQVSEKETLYAISRRYGVSIMSILEVNKTADGGLEVGQILKVPYLPKSKVQTAQGIIHKVGPKETMFSISKLYDVPIEDIRTANNLKDNALSPGQELIIRRSTPANATVKPVEVKSTNGTHTVAPKETLYSISKLYGITVQQLKDWNGLTTNEVKIDQVLMVRSPQAATAPVTAEVISQPPPVKETPIAAETPKVPATQPKESTIKISENVAGSDEVREKGVTELIEGTEGNRKYLAQYNSAKPGTIVKVRNDANNREVFVRVTGPLPADASSGTVIRISKSAMDRLGALESRFTVEVTFYK